MSGRACEIIFYCVMQTDKTIRVAVIGSRGSGKSALCDRLVSLSEELGFRQLRFAEYHNHEDEMDCFEHDVVLQVVDAMDLEQSLSLTPHLIDHHHHLVLAINRYDLLLKTDHHLDVPKFRELIGVPVEMVSAATGEGLKEILHTLIEVQTRPESHAHPVYHAWEQDDADAYRAYVHGVLTQTLVHSENDKHTALEFIDQILTNKWFGFPILALLLGFVFWCTFALGSPLQDLLQLGVDWLHDLVVAHMHEGWLCSLLAEGIIKGVGSLLTALPNIIILFFFLSMMEDTGYMARVAYLMDGFMHSLGLHGRSFIPMLMGFDCNVPAIMAAKDIQDPKNRALTMLMVPFMSCSARLPVYILFISVFFVQYKALVLMSLYLLGILVSFLFGWLMKKTKWFRTGDDDCVNELPNFRLPSWRSILGHIWYRVSDFLQKISTVVLFASVIIWALEYFPAGDLSHLESSYLAAVGRLIEPLMLPLGFDWKMSVCLLTGLPAKEAIASTFAILFGGDLTQAAFTPVSAYAFLVFTLLYFPCVATVSTIRREVNWKWALFTVVNSILIAWMMAFVIYQVGSWIAG